MAKEIILPDLGMDMDEALLINWTKNPGDTIQSGDVIAEVETDKTTVEVQATVSGTLLEWKFEPGETLKIGSVVGFVGEAGESAPAEEAAPAPVAAPVEEAAPAPVPVEQATTDDGRLKVSPVAMKIALEKGIDIRQVQGTGPGGRIVKKDVENFKPAAAPPPSAPAEAPAPAASTPAPVAPAPKPAASLPSNVGTIAGPSFGKLPSSGDVETEDVSKLRGKIAERMVTSKQQIPHFYVTMEIASDALLALRKQLNAGIDDKAKSISVNDMIVKAVALAARDFPVVNRHYYGEQYVVNKRVNVGIAVALDNGGLINVVAHDADRTALGILATENRAKIKRARDGKVKPEDISGSTITVSNLGMFGVDNFIAIVTPPEAAIIAVGAAKKTPVVKEDGSIGVATVMKLTLSADHRTVNGAEGGEFMAALRDYLENPMRLL